MLLTTLMRILLTRSPRPFVFEGRSEDRLDFVGLRDLGLYVHIPFCRQLCSFCPYCKEIYDAERASRYKDALLREIDLVCGGMTEKKTVTSLYFGGGTPALMIDSLGDIIKKLRRYFSISGGIGAELHPDDLTPGVLQKLKDAGVTMVSIGIQSFDEGCLSKLGRRNTGIENKMSLVRNAGFEVVDIDLIFAMPGQTDEILWNDIRTAFDSGATQVSTYPFIDFTFADNAYKPMGKRVKKRMLKNLQAFCRENGLERTSVWTFARSGTGRYSSVTREAFLGFGVSAATLLNTSFKINTFSIDGYIGRILSGKLPTSLTLAFTPRQRAAYFLFWSTYSMRIDSMKFKEIIGKPIGQMYRLELYISEKLGYLRKTESGYIVTDKAADAYHDIEQAYTAAYIDRMWNVSGNVAFPDKIVLK